MSRVLIDNSSKDKYFIIKNFVTFNFADRILELTTSQGKFSFDLGCSHLDSNVISFQDTRIVFYSSNTYKFHWFQETNSALNKFYLNLAPATYDKFWKWIEVCHNLAQKSMYDSNELVLDQYRFTKQLDNLISVWFKQEELVTDKFESYYNDADKLRFVGNHSAIVFHCAENFHDQNIIFVNLTFPFLNVVEKFFKEPYHE